MLSPSGFLLGVGAAVLVNLTLLWIWRRRRTGHAVLRSPQRPSRNRTAFTSRAGLLFITALLAAAVPSALVFFDRWLSPPLPAQYFIGPWCRLEFLCQLQFPPYFIIAFLSIPALALLLRSQSAAEQGLFQIFPANNPAPEHPAAIPPAQKRLATGLLALSGAGLVGLIVRAWLIGQPPGFEYALLGAALTCGWWLRTVPLGQPPPPHTKPWLRLDLLLPHLLLVATLAAFYTKTALAWLPALLLTLSLVNLVRSSRQVPLMFWLISLALVAYSLYINAWWFTIIGDDYEFFYFARSIATDYQWTTIWSRFFDGQGVYGTHPFLSSLVQAVSIRMFGANPFGWLFSNLYLSALALFFFYRFFSAFVQQRAAIFAVFVLAVSHYLMAFGKIGYNNLQAYFVLALNLASATWAVQNRKTGAFFILGGTLGLCFYTYPGALYTLAAVGCLLLFYIPPVSRSALQRWGALALSLGIWIYPLALQPGYWQAKLPGTLFAQAELVGTTGRIIGHLAANTLYSFFSPVYIPEESHFVTIAYLDFFTAALFFLGFLSLAWQVRRQRSAAFLAFSFIVMLILVGATHDRPTPSTTRMFLLLPWFALFAALGMMWLQNRAVTLRLVGPPGKWGLSLVLIVILGINVYQAYALTRLRMVRYQSIQALFLKITQPLLEEAVDAPAKFLFANDPATWDIVDLQDALVLYQYPPETVQISVFVPAGETLAAPEIQALQAQGTYIILNPSLNNAWRRAAQDLLIRLGRTSCEVRNGLGQPRFRVWYLPGMGDICG